MTYLCNDSQGFRRHKEVGKVYALGSTWTYHMCLIDTTRIPSLQAGNDRKSD